ncbi:unnamed protein product [Vitrella brassicaformis CCMP3155]|uniref:DEK C-terminal domain-containing protein n=1 Tax=Vitrella brassicaformis (strain CCMP3155) TaxID=1169540 RepID=A0A0G4EBL3_VITBC|nr:unnamed protein product [Vitrella brassicaformis CCMP3155]|eukprot:CEL93366.1 unnamed protein product [Vitrella brassicaformis CCMP3155]
MVENLSNQQLFDLVKKVMDNNENENLTPKLVRRYMEQEMSLPEHAMDVRKDEIRQLIDKFVGPADADADMEGGGSPHDSGEAARASGPVANGVTKESGEDEDDKDKEEDADEDEDYDEDEDDGGSKKRRKTSRAKPAASKKRKTSAPRGGRTSVKAQQMRLMTKAYFDQNAAPLKMKIGPHEESLSIKTFKSGSRGWYINKKLPIDIGGHQGVTCQANCIITVVGSQQWKEGGKVDDDDDDDEEED